MNEELTSQLVEDAPCGIAASCPEGRLLYVNATLASWIGRPADEICEQLDFAGLLTKPSRIFYETHLSPMLRLQGFVREISCSLAIAGGDVWPVLVNGVTRLDDAGAPVRFDFTIFDARERHMYEAQLRKAQQESDELAAIVRSSPNAILRVDPKGRIKSWNAGAERLLQNIETETKNALITDVIPFEAKADWFQEAKTIAAKQGEALFEVKHSDGSELEVTVAPIISKHRRRAPRDLSVIMRDVSARKSAERHLRLSMDEMKHRIKNTLSVVAGIARQSLPKDVRESFIDRLQALAVAHDRLAVGPGEASDLCDLLEDAAQEAGGPDRLRFERKSVQLTPKQTTSLSMAFHEMITNAFKYGALSMKNGYVEIAHTVRSTPEGQALRIIWEEHGGPKVVPPSREGFGSKMIKVVLAAELAAQVEVDFLPEGCRYLIEFHLASSAGDPA